MVQSINDLQLYKIPSDAVINHRKEFYGLVRKKGDQTKTWLNQIQKQIKRCKFSKSFEYLLIDKFVCELNRDEKNSMRTAADTWSQNQLNQYCDNKMSGTEIHNEKEDMYIDEQPDEPIINIVKFEPTIFRKSGN